MPNAYDASLQSTRDIGPRPAASAAELRAHRHVAARFRAAGLRTAVERLTVPRHGRSRNVFRRARHARALPDDPHGPPRHGAPGPGANDNASAVGVLVARGAARPQPEAPCDVWLVATGAEERILTGHGDHLGA